MFGFGGGSISWKSNFFLRIAFHISGCLEVRGDQYLGRAILFLFFLRIVFHISGSLEVGGDQYLRSEGLRIGH